MAVLGPVTDPTAFLWASLAAALVAYFWPVFHPKRWGFYALAW